jgi:hypothetical protein
MCEGQGKKGLQGLDAVVGRHGRRVARFKEEQARRVMEESWRKETRSDRIRQGERVLKPL